jgi:hypothetical protein
VQETSDYQIEYEGPAFLGESYLGGYFRLIRDGHHDREIAFRLSEYALQELCEREGWEEEPGLSERLLVAWARYEIEREMQRQGRVNPILVGATSDLDLYPELLDVLRKAAEELPAPIDAVVTADEHEGHAVAAAAH